MVLLQAVFLAASPLVTAPPSNLTPLYYNGSAAKSHSTTTQYRQLRRLGKGKICGLFQKEITFRLRYVLGMRNCFARSHSFLFSYKTYTQCIMGKWRLCVSLSRPIQCCVVPLRSIDHFPSCESG